MLLSAANYFSVAISHPFSAVQKHSSKYLDPKKKREERDTGKNRPGKPSKKIETLKKCFDNKVVRWLSGGMERKCNSVVLFAEKTLPVQRRENIFCGSGAHDRVYPCADFLVIAYLLRDRSLRINFDNQISEGQRNVCWDYSFDALKVQG